MADRPEAVGILTMGLTTLGEGEVLLTVALPEDASFARVDPRGQVLVQPGYIIRE